MNSISEKDRIRCHELLDVMLDGGKVTVTDKADGVKKESQIVNIYCDCTIDLADAIYSDYSIWEVSTFKPIIDQEGGEL